MVNEQTEGRLIDLDARVQRLEEMLLAQVDVDSHTKPPPDWDRLLEIPAFVRWMHHYTELFNEYEELPEKFEERPGSVGS